MEMKIKTIFSLVSVLSLFVLCACATDTNNGGFDSASVCPEEGTNAYGMPNRGSFVDERDGQEYKYVTIGEQVWMNDNLNFQTEYSLCIDRVDDSCDKYGRLYGLQYGIEYMRKTQNYDDTLSGFLIEKLVEDACPGGWHIPTRFEWETLVKMVGVENLQKDECWNFSAYRGGIARSYWADGGKIGYKSTLTDAAWWSRTYSSMFSGRGGPMVYFVNFDDSDYLKQSENMFLFIRCVKD